MWQSGVSSASPRTVGSSLSARAKHRAQAAKALPASLGCLSGNAGACRHGREPGAPRGVTLKVGGLVVRVQPLWEGLEKQS